MSITATIQGSINLTFVTDASGMAVTGSTTSTASLALGNVSMFGGTVPDNVTKTVNATTSFGLSTPFDVRVDLANSASTTYTLAAMLSAAEAAGKVWTLGPTDISAGYRPRQRLVRFRTRSTSRRPLTNSGPRGTGFDEL